MTVTRFGPLTGTDALDLLGAMNALHDARDLPALLDVLPSVIAPMIPFDAFDVLGPRLPRRTAVAEQAPGSAQPAHRLAVVVPDPADALAGVLLGRRARPFDRREAALAALLGPLLGAAVDHVRLRALHAGAATRLRALTARERQVLAMVADGRSTRAIASALGIEAGTVEKHVEHIRAKLGVRSRAEAAAMWARASWPAR